MAASWQIPSTLFAPRKPSSGCLLVRAGEHARTVQGLQVQLNLCFPAALLCLSPCLCPCPHAPPPGLYLRVLQVPFSSERKRMTTASLPPGYE